mgnify:CR=1 FL=1
MSDSDYEEEDLDSFMIKASSILSQERHPDKATMLESLKQHLSSIFHDNAEMENFFKTLNSVIFSSPSKKAASQKIVNKQSFKLYPIIFSFNPKTCYFYVDYFLTSLQISASEQNRVDFPYLGSIFGEVIKAFFSDQKNNNNLIKKNFVLEQNKKLKLYEKFLNFCNSNIKTNKKTEQSFGCLLLTEFLEKCPMTKDEKNLDELFKIISEYLDDRWFECKLDLLNCTISLIFTAEKNFKPYASLCLFKVLDYLTDEEWMKRKLAINIVYTLAFYCQEEILSVKENIMDFLTALKSEPNKEVREICQKTLDYFEQIDPNKDESEDFKSVDNKVKPKSNNNKNKSANKSFDTYDKADNISKISGKSNRTNKAAASKAETNYMKRLKKEQDLLDQLEREYNQKRSNFTYNRREDKIREEVGEETYDLIQQLSSTVKLISQQIKKIQDEQKELNSMYDEVKHVVDKNYSKLNDRITAFENEYLKAEEDNNENENDNTNSDGKNVK